MSLKNLKPGAGFRAKIGAGSFKKKLYTATKHGDLQHLADNQEAIVEAVTSKQRAIKKGGLTRLQRKQINQEIKRKDKKLTKADKLAIKGILEDLGKGKNKDENKPSPVKSQPVKKAINRRDIINRARDTGALQQDDPRRANISALGSVGNQPGGFANSPKINNQPGFANSPKPVTGPVKPGMPSPPLNNSPMPSQSGKRPIGF